ncbi:MAG: hypothetical protein ACR2RL_17630, partial [Gammaproteobacteria bacterium]
ARSGRIGRPVFVRWTATYECAAQAASACVGEGLSAASALFGKEPKTTTQVGSNEAGNLCLLCRWAGGETALIASGPAARRHEAGYDIALIGNEGAAYHTGTRWRGDK